MSRTQNRIRDHFNFGVKYVWVIDPVERRAWIYTGSESREVLDGILCAGDPEITVSLSDLFPE